MLALVPGQDVEAGATEGSWRIAERIAVGRVISTVDVESRHWHKSRRVYRDGHKANGAAEPDTGLVTACSVTPATAADGTAGVALIDGEAPSCRYRRLRLRVGRCARRRWP